MQPYKNYFIDDNTEANSTFPFVVLSTYKDEFYTTYKAESFEDAKSWINDRSSEMEEDYLRYFDNKKITMTGIHGGSYLYEDDFNTYGRWATQQNESITKGR